MTAIDRRTTAAQALLAWRKKLPADLRGETTVSAQQMDLVEAAVRTRFSVDTLNAWIQKHGSLVTPGAGRSTRWSGSGSSSSTAWPGSWTA